MDNFITSSSAIDHQDTRWGMYDVLLHLSRENDNKVKVKRIVLAKGENISYQKHEKRSEIWLVSSGTGYFYSDGDNIDTIKQGCILVIPKEKWHTIKANEDSTLEIIEIQYGEAVDEDDIIRKFYEWSEIVSYVKGGKK